MAKYKNIILSTRQNLTGIWTFKATLYFELHMYISLFGRLLFTTLISLTLL